MSKQPHKEKHHHSYQGDKMPPLKRKNRSEAMDMDRFDHKRHQRNGNPKDNDDHHRSSSNRYHSRGRESEESTRRRSGGRDDDYYRSSRDRGYRGYKMEPKRGSDYGSHYRKQHRGEASPDEYQREAWNCPECRHTPSGYKCRDCGTEQVGGRRKSRDADHDEGHRPRGRRESLDDFDEFGRNRSNGNESKDTQRKKASMWPPAFDRKSATYILDARSGMFYHASTKFYYDPKSKLYYGTQQQQYYQYRPGQKPPFQKYEAPKTETDATDAAPTTTTPVTPAISITLKTKTLSRTCQKETNVENKVTPSKASVVSRAEKVRAANLDRWKERQEEQLGVIKTKDGKPCCLICQRKFRSMQHLQRHLELSDMHKSNVSKMARRATETGGADDAFYRDRAHERRVLYGPEVSAVDSQQLFADPEATVATNAPADNLNEKHIGHQMLQKLGWKEEAGPTKSQSTLKKDWERIEAIASSCFTSCSPFHLTFASRVVKS